MLKKKILLGMLVLGSCTACITQATNITGTYFNGASNLIYELVQLENGEEGYFTEANIIATTKNQFILKNVGNGNRTEYYNTETFDNMYRIHQGGYDTVYQTRYWNTNGRIEFLPGGYSENWSGGGIITPLNVCKSDINSYTGQCITQSPTNYNYSIEDMYNEITSVSTLSFGYLQGNYMTYLCMLGNNNAMYCYACKIGDYKAQGSCLGGQTFTQYNDTRYDSTLNDLVEYVGESPFNAGPGTEGTPIACRNINTMIKAYGNKYNTGMCYTPNLILDENYQIISTGQISIFEIFTGFDQYTNLYNLYYNNCHTPYTTEHCMNAMSGNIQAVNFFNYVKNANEEGLNKVTAPQLYQYCHLQLNFTDEEKETEGTCTLNNEILYATGITEETGNPSPLDMISNILDEEIGIGIVTPTTGTVFDEFLEDGETRLEGISINWIKTFKEAYTKVMGLFKYRNTQTGIIPGYITSLILIILLLALFKK